MSGKFLLKNEHGYTIVISLFIIVLLSIIGLGLMLVTSNTLNATKHERNDQSMFYIAEGAINVKKHEIYNSIYSAYDDTRTIHQDTKEDDRENIDFVEIFINKVEEKIPNAPFSYNYYERQFGKQPEACIEVDIESRIPLIINIESTGYLLDPDDIIGDTCSSEIVKLSRKVKQTIEVDLNLKFLTSKDGDPITGFPNLAVQTTGDILLTGSAEINGSAVTNFGSVILEGGVNITGTIGTSQPLNAPNWLIEQKNLNERLVNKKVAEIPLPDFPSSSFESLKASQYPLDFPLTDGSYAAGWNPPHSKSDLILLEDAKLNNFSVPAGKTINIYIGENTVNLLIENTFSIGSNATVNIIGNGKLNIYVKNSLTITGTLGTTNRDPNKIDVYYAGTSTPKIDDGGSLIAASIYAEKSDLSLSGGGGISGNIISGGSKVTIGGGRRPTGQYILAPKAQVILGGDYKGVIIANSYFGRDYGTVTYGPGVVPLPFLPDYSDPIDMIIEEGLIEISAPLAN